MEHRPIRTDPRIPDFAYDHGGYFVTICTKERTPVFGSVVGAGLEPAPTPLPEVVRQFKTFSAKRINRLRGTPGAPVWQRNYYEHGIRSEEDWRDCANYILNNPTAWMLRKKE